MRYNYGSHFLIALHRYFPDISVAWVHMKDCEATSPGFLPSAKGLVRSIPPRLWVICAWMLVGLYAGGIFVLSSLSHPPLVSTWELPHLDKLYHAIEYGGLTFVLIHALCLTCASRASTGIVLGAAVLAIAYGASDEFHQAFTPYRTMSAYDLVANAMGAGAVALVWLSVRRRRPLLVESDHSWSRSRP
jgi:VanZ family protein